MANELFNRHIVLEVGDFRIESKVESGIRQGLSVQFDVERSLSPSPNKARIQIWGLSEDERNQIKAQTGVIRRTSRVPDLKAATATVVTNALLNGISKNTVLVPGITKTKTKIESVHRSIPVKLHAGYLSQKPTLIYSGELTDANTTKPGSEIITTIETGDGQKALRRSRARRSFGPGTKVETVIRYLARQLGMKINNESLIKNAAFEQVGQTYVKGVTLSGRAGHELARIAQACGLEFSIQEGVITFVERGKPVSNEAILLTDSTGLIESPEKGKKGIVRAKALIVPGLVPGRRIRFNDDTIRGFFRAWRVRYEGSMFSQPFYAHVECKEV